MAWVDFSGLSRNQLEKRILKLEANLRWADMEYARVQQKLREANNRVACFMAREEDGEIKWLKKTISRLESQNKALQQERDQLRLQLFQQQRQPSPALTTPTVACPSPFPSPHHSPASVFNSPNHGSPWSQNVSPVNGWRTPNQLGSPFRPPQNSPASAFNSIPVTPVSPPRSPFSFPGSPYAIPESPIPESPLPRRNPKSI